MAYGQKEFAGTGSADTGSAIEGASLISKKVFWYLLHFHDCGQPPVENTFCGTPAGPLREVPYRQTVHSRKSEAVSCTDRRHGGHLHNGLTAEIR
jgi:hypothetical protein